MGHATSFHYFVARLLKTFQLEVCFYSLIHEYCKTRHIESSCLIEAKTWMVRILNPTVKESDRVVGFMNKTVTQQIRYITEISSFCH